MTNITRIISYPNLTGKRCRNIPSLMVIIRRWSYSLMIIIEVLSLHVLHKVLPTGVRRGWWNLPSMLLMLLPINKRKLIGRHMLRWPNRIPLITHSNTISMSKIVWRRRYRKTVERTSRFWHVHVSIFRDLMVHCITDRLAMPRGGHGLNHRGKWVVFQSLQTSSISNDKVSYELFIGGQIICRSCEAYL